MDLKAGWITKILVVLCALLLSVLLCKGCQGNKVVRTVTKYRNLVDTLMVKGPTRFIERWTEVTSDPETVQVVTYTEIPTTVDFIGCTIKKDWVTIEYMNGDSLQSVVLFVERQSYGETKINVSPDTTVQVTYPAVGLAPAITTGTNFLNFSELSLGVETFYWNNPILFDAIHFPIFGVCSDISNSNWGVFVGISGDIDSQHTPFRFESTLRYGMVRTGFYGTVGISCPIWSF